MLIEWKKNLDIIWAVNQSQTGNVKLCKLFSQKLLQ